MFPSFNSWLNKKTEKCYSFTVGLGSLKPTFNTQYQSNNCKKGLQHVFHMQTYTSQKNKTKKTLFFILFLFFHQLITFGHFYFFYSPSRQPYLQIFPVNLKIKKLWPKTNKGDATIWTSLVWESNQERKMAAVCR